MITLTVVTFSIICGVASGIFKLLFAIFGVFLEIMLASMIVASIGIFGLGILFLVDAVFLIVKIIR